MAYKQRESPAKAAADKRMTALHTIDPTKKLDLGNGHTIPSFQAAIDLVESDLENYNTGLKTLDALKNKLDASEKDLNKKSSAMLTGVGQKYTKDSSEYEQCGGVRESERKKPVRKPKPKP